MTFIKTLKDKFNNIVYPVTKEKAVYDDNGIRLDNKLSHTLKIGNYTQDALGNIRINNTNIDEIFTANMYFISNCYDGEGNTLNGSLIVSCPTANDITQIFVDAVTNKLMIRTRWGGTWRGWNESIGVPNLTSSDLVNDPKKIPTSEVTYELSQRSHQYRGHYAGDLNDLLTEGNFVALNCPNKPIDGADWGNCLVFSGGTGSFVLIYISNSVSANVHIRHHNGSSWSDWGRLIFNLSNCNLKFTDTVLVYDQNNADTLRIALYDYANGNHAGIGVDGSGNIHFRTGLNNTDSNDFVFTTDGKIKINGVVKVE